LLPLKILLLKNNNMHIHWGIIGCGDVTEVKSGPAFNKIAGSSLYAVMRRDHQKAADYAQRHQVPVFYSDAMALIKDPIINAVYIATPPDSHELYALATIEAGKPVYVEKPMTLNSFSAKKITAFAKEKDVKLVVAHYRNAQPIFLKVKELLKQNVIGKLLTAQIDYRRKPPTAKELLQPTLAWRLNPAQSGGGLFHDLAPHQLGLMQFFFGNPVFSKGISGNHHSATIADDLITGLALFEKGIQFSGVWNFNAAPDQESDVCIIRGTKGSIEFSVFNNTSIRVLLNNLPLQVLEFPPLPHVQQPMIEKVVAYFNGTGSNPCTPESAATVMEMMDAFVFRANFPH